jgi:CHAT domain-containing protein
MAGGATRVFHFATHGLPQSDGVATTLLRLGHETFAVEDLVGAELARGLEVAAPLVVMNACHSARREQGLTRVTGWPERLLDLGASAFIGANWAVNDVLACEFTRRLYDALAAGEPIARAVRLARLALREADPDNSTWLAYSLYAHPNAKAQPA